MHMWLPHVNTEAFVSLYKVETPIVTGSSNKVTLILQRILLEQLLSQEYNKMTTSVSVHSAAKPLLFLFFK